MSQHDYNLANDTGAAFRSDLNSALSAIVTQNSGVTEPSSMFARMVWLDTTTSLRKRRNAANSGWIVDGTIQETLVVSRSSDTQLTINDYGRTFVATNSFTQTFAAASSLGDGWHIFYRNDGVGTITLDPNASEQIDGANTLALAAGESVRIACNGSSFKTQGNPANLKTGTLAQFNAALTDAEFGITLIGEVASTSGTAVAFTGIPAGVRRITALLQNVSMNGTAGFSCVIGDSGGYETSGYSSVSAVITNGASPGTGGNTSAFGMVPSGAISVADAVHGSIVLERLAGNKWVARGSLNLVSPNSLFVFNGFKELSAELDRLKIESNGASSFDAGSINVSYEF